MSDWLMRVIKAEAKQLIAPGGRRRGAAPPSAASRNEILAATRTKLALSRISASSRNLTSSANVEPDEPENSTESEEPLRELTLGRSVPAEERAAS